MIFKKNGKAKKWTRLMTLALAAQSIFTFCQTVPSNALSAGVFGPPIESLRMPHIPNEFIAMATSTNAAESRRWFGSNGFRLVSEITYGDNVAFNIARLDGDECAGFRALKGARPLYAAQPNFVEFPQQAAGLNQNMAPGGSLAPADSNPTLLSTQAYHLGQSHASAAWKHSTGRGIRIAVIDTGVAIINALRSNVVNRAKIDLAQSIEPLFTDEHGTAVAGVIAATRSNLLGVPGVAPDAAIISIKATENQNIFASDMAIMKSIVKAEQLEAKIINIGFNQVPQHSLVETLYHPGINEFAKQFSRRGLVFLPAGNTSYFDEESLRTNYLIPVSSIGRNGSLSNFASTGRSMWFAASGENIPTYTKNSTIQLSQGSSFSSAIVSGIAALVWSANPAMDRTEVLSKLRQACPYSQPTIMYGYGLPDAEKAVSLAKFGTFPAPGN